MKADSRIPVVVAHSGGKDSLLALHRLPADYRPVALVTHVQGAQERVSVHGVRRHLIEQQAEALGLPLHVIELPDAPSNAEYEARIAAGLEPFLHAGIQHIVYGDLFLEDIRAYRDAHLARLGMRAVYPLWGQDTAQLAQACIRDGFRAVIVCVDTTRLDAAFVGRALDAACLRDLPAGIDPCGENGEFHTFVHDAPLFRAPIPVTIGARFWRDDRFCLCDLG
ncbi:MAG: diphthine--ammonia ligase [Anaerolinea sp.]|nr:diphthine--ammonia ligase [Anaerolinea sp.]